jgi:2-haloacid dehalogenase
MTPPYTWLLFDADDTLFDYGKAEAAGLAQTFAAFGLGFQPAYLALYHRFNLQVWKALERGEITWDRLKVRRFELLLSEIGQSAGGSLPSPEAFSDAYIEQLVTCAQLVEGAEETLRALHGRFRFAILTNGLSKVQRGRVQRSAIRPYISALVISEEIGAAKPSGSYFDAAFSQIGHPPKSQALMIGDSLTSDMRGACDYGLDACWVNRSGQPRPADLPIRYEIRDLRELIPLLSG